MDKLTSAENVVYYFTYDSSGNPLTSKVGYSVTFINASAAYIASENYLKTLTDSKGNTLTNTWDETKGILSNSKDPKGNTINYGYDTLDRLQNVTKTVDGNAVSNSYSYIDDKLNTITHNVFNYNFDYDSLGNNTEVSVGTQNLIKNTFEARTGKLIANSLHS